MSVASEVDNDMQSLVRVFTHGDGHDLLTAEPGTDVWAENVEDVLHRLLAMGWLPPTHADVVRLKVRESWEADNDTDAFHALGTAAVILNVQLVDPHTEAAPALQGVA